MLNEIDVISFEPSDAEVAGRLQADLRRTGQNAPIADLIVGAHALARGCTLVTANTRCFENIPGLTLLNWRLAPDEQEPSHA